MMTDTTTGDQPPVVDPLRHEVQYELNEEDMLDVAMLYNTVGKELTTVDKHGVDAKKATKLDESKVFNKKMTQSNTNSSPHPQSPPSPPSIPPAVPQQPPTAQPQQPMPQLTHMQPVPAMISVDNSEIISRITAMEEKVESLLNVYEKLLEKIAKGSRRMTLTINDRD